MTAAVLAPLAAGDPGRYAALAAARGGSRRRDLLRRRAAAARLSGGPAFAAGAGRLHDRRRGHHDRRPTRQDDRHAGEGDEFVDQVRSFVNGLGGVHWPTVALAAAVLVVLLALARLAPRLPGPLIAVLAAPLPSSRCSRSTATGSPSSARSRRAAGTRNSRHLLADLSALLLPAAGIAIVAFSDNVLTARTFAARQGERHRCQRRVAGAGRLQRRRRSDCRVSGELQRESHRTRRRGRQPHPAAIRWSRWPSCSR